MEGNIHGRGGRRGCGVLAHDTSGIANGSAVRRQRLENYRAGADLAVVADLDIAQDRGVAADEDVVAYLRVTKTLLLPRGTESHSMKEGAVGAHRRCFTDHDSGGVVDHQTYLRLRVVEEVTCTRNTSADSRGRVDIYGEEFGAA